MAEDEEEVPQERPAYPIVARAMTEEELAAAREYADTVARVDQSGKVFRHICLLLGHAEAHGFTKKEAAAILDSITNDTGGPSKYHKALDSVEKKLREAWL